MAERRAKDAWEKNKVDKPCRRCNKTKPYDAFPRGGLGANNRIIRRPVCKACVKLQKPINRKALKEYKKLHPRPILGEAFQCPICRITTYTTHRNQSCLDHDHKTGKIRGYICGYCNSSMGKFNESIPTMLRAIAWLMGFGKFFRKGQ